MINGPKSMPDLIELKSENKDIQSKLPTTEDLKKNTEKDSVIKHNESDASTSNGVKVIYIIKSNKSVSLVFINLLEKYYINRLMFKYLFNLYIFII